AAAPAAPANAGAVIDDPLEPVNRAVFEFNQFVDGLLLKPIAGLYRVMVPPPVRDLIGGVLDNMGEPVNFANNLLQGDVTAATETLGRFAINTTAGVGGMFDVASEVGLNENHGDFGQTLNSWGLGSGPYLVLPLLGPSNLRDAVGFGVDSLTSPWGYIAQTGPQQTEDLFDGVSAGARFLDRRSENIENLENIEKGAIDFYATLRSVFTQFRNRQLGVEETIDPTLYRDDGFEPLTSE
ncbi:VacJ family lipoprotein, partial [Candidatus Raskinella chloraquaticus]|uniref:MlaA family lipoprotein n=1 Tax=Candidatus Raskinella chloraquaticus TaxID=1951219 RepID=UPI00366A7994